MVKQIASYIVLNVVLIPYYYLIFVIGVMGIGERKTSFFDSVIPFLGIITVVFTLASLPSLLLFFFFKRRQVQKVQVIFCVERVINLLVFFSLFLTVFIMAS